MRKLRYYVKRCSPNCTNLQARRHFLKISKPAGNWWGTPFLGNSSWGALHSSHIVEKDSDNMIFFMNLTFAKLKKNQTRLTTQNDYRVKEHVKSTFLFTNIKTRDSRNQNNSSSNKYIIVRRLRYTPHDGPWHRYKIALCFHPSHDNASIRSEMKRDQVSRIWWLCPFTVCPYVERCASHFWLKLDNISQR